MMDLKEKLLAEMKQNELARANGRVMRALNVLYPKYNSLRGIQIALSDDGIGEELYTAWTFSRWKGTSCCAPSRTMCRCPIWQTTAGSIWKASCPARVPACLRAA